MKKYIFSILAMALCQSLFSASAFATEYQLMKSTVTYHVVHPLHKIDATSTGARGKGVCKKNTGCEFLIAAPIASFDSGNTNRDTHAQQSVRAGLYPTTSLRIHTPDEKFDKVIKTKAVIELNGVPVEKNIEIQLQTSGKEVSASGRLQLKLSDFKIEPPALLMVKTNDDFTVDFNSTWQVN